MLIVGRDWPVRPAAPPVPGRRTGRRCRRGRAARPGRRSRSAVPPATPRRPWRRRGAGTAPRGASTPSVSVQRSIDQQHDHLRGGPGRRADVAWRDAQRRRSVGRCWVSDSRLGSRSLGLSIRTLALLTRFLGAKLGANNHRHGATPGHTQPFPLHRNGTSGHTWHHLATLRKCLLSSRSRGRGAHLEAQVRRHLRRTQTHSHDAGAVAVPVACPMASSWGGPTALLPACSARRRWPAAARRRHAGIPSRRGSWSAPSGPSARGGWRLRPP
jgi:hypothetical protein